MSRYGCFLSYTNCCNFEWDESWVNLQIIVCICVCVWFFFLRMLFASFSSLSLSLSFSIFRYAPALSLCLMHTHTQKRIALIHTHMWLIFKLLLRNGMIFALMSLVLWNNKERIVMRIDASHLVYCFFSSGVCVCVCVRPLSVGDVWEPNLQTVKLDR